MKQNRHQFQDRLWQWSEAVVTDPDPPPAPREPPAPCPPSLSSFPFFKTKPTYGDPSGASALPRPAPGLGRSLCPRGSTAQSRPHHLHLPTPRGRTGEGRAQARVARPPFPAEKATVGLGQQPHPQKGIPEVRHDHCSCWKHPTAPGWGLSPPCLPPRGNTQGVNTAVPKSRSSHAELCVKRLKGSFLPPPSTPLTGWPDLGTANGCSQTRGEGRRRWRAAPGAEGRSGRGGTGRVTPRDTWNYNLWGGKNAGGCKCRAGTLHVRTDRQLVKVAIPRHHFSPLISLH